MRATAADKQAEIARYKQIYAAGYSTPGDAGRGRVIYDKICGQCHTLFEVGGKVGPISPAARARTSITSCKTSLIRTRRFRTTTGPSPWTRRTTV
ncbi:MAG: hypothetical protein HC814_05215 [Rhodobacteraceae bacterium]|nr:hypothetical protein [Paracoccaceae bacterium]